MSRPFDLIMFDLDGTLVETAPEIADATNDTLRHLGLAQVSQQQVNDWIGHGTRALLIKALAYVRQTAPTEVEANDSFAGIKLIFDEFYRQRCGTRSRLYPQVRETLLALRSQGIRLAVVTNKEGRYTEAVLAAHHLTPLLDTVVSGDTLPCKKPDPAGIQHCLQQWSVAAVRALFVGDSSIDVASARNAGVAVWALPYGYNMGQPISDCDPDRVIEDCSALLDL